MAAEAKAAAPKKYTSAFRPDLYAGKVVFCTGGGSGIGMTVVEELMRHGADACIASRSLQRVQEAADILQKNTGRKCLALAMDVRNVEQVDAAVDKCLKEYGRIDVLINNAAGNFLSAIENLSVNAFNTVMNIDAHGTFIVTKSVFHKYFKAHGGNVINITASLHWKGDAMQLHAGSAKAAIEAMTKHMSVEWGRYGIRVNNLCPGPIGDTVGYEKLGGSWMRDNPKLYDEYVGNIPAQRMGTRHDCAQAALYLGSNECAGYVTGSTVTVDGGAWMTSGGIKLTAMSKIGSTKQTAGAGAQQSQTRSKL